MLPHCLSFTRKFSHVWLWYGYESRNLVNFFSILAIFLEDCVKIGRYMSISGEFSAKRNFLTIFLMKKKPNGKIRLKENAGDDLPYVYLGKFGTIQNMKVDNLKHPFMCNKIW